MAKMTYCPWCREPLAPKEIEEITRLCCTSETCEYVFWDSPTPVVAAIVGHEGKVIFARNKAWPPDMFGLITGFLEKDEAPEIGVLREVKEELGLDGEIAELVGLYPFSMMNQLLIAYFVPARGEVILGDEIAEIKRVSIEDVKPWNFGTGLAVADWLKRRKDS